MPKKHLVISAAILAILIFICGYRTAAHFAHVRELETAQASKPSAESVLIALKGQGFLITQTYLFNQSVTVDHASGSFFKDFFWNQVVSATAYVKVSAGVDLSALSADNVAMDEAKKITISLSLPTRYSTEIIGSVEVKNKQGVLKKLLDNDDGYNQAVAALKEQAEQALLKPDLQRELQQESAEEVSRLVRLLLPETSVEIVFR